MNNEHSRSFNESYKAKVRDKIETDGSKPVDVIDSMHEMVDYDCFPENIDVDVLLSEFVKSEFDFNTLNSWDKIRKN